MCNVVCCKKNKIKKKIKKGHILFGFAAVGVVDYYASGKACPHGLGCDQLQLERDTKVNTALITHPCSLSVS